MTYKKILIPHNQKQKHITIPKELGLKPDDEIILLKKEDYEILNAKDNTELLDKIKETIKANKLSYKCLILLEIKSDIGQYLGVIAKKGKI